MRRVPVEIATNLVQPLRYLRSDAQPFTIWADAVCINKSDMCERNRRVTLTQYIHPKADSVILWAGEADDSTEPVMQLVGQVR